MQLIVKSAKITSASSEKLWGGAFCENGLFVLLEIEGKDDTSAAKTGNQVLEELLTRFTNFKEHNLETVAELIEKTGSKTQITLLIIGLLQDKSLFLGSIGNGQVLLKRQNKIGQILSSNEKSRGELKEEDKLFFFSERLDKVLPSDKKQQLLNLTELEEAEDTLAAFLSGNVEIKGIAALLISIGKESKERQLLSSIVRFKATGRERLSQVIAKGRTIITGRMIRPHEESSDNRAKKTLLTIAIILVLLLTFSIFFNISHTANSHKKQQLSEALDLTAHQYEEAVSLIDLNPVRSRELLSAGKLSLAPLLKEFPKNSGEYKQINEWLGKLSSSEVAAYRIYKLSAVPLFFDINFIKQGGIGDRMVAYREMKVVLDTKNKVIYTLSTKTKQAEILAGSEVVKEARTITIHGTTVYLLNSDGIIGIDIASKTARTIVKPDDRWGEIAVITAFAGNLYLLDSKNHIIWKYIATDYGFSERLSYLNPDVRVNFSDSKNMLIDGSVWVLKNSDVLKFTRGQSVPFAFKGFSESLTDLTSFSTSDVDNNLYLLDKATSRIVVFDKDGAYQSQYQWDDLGNASDFVVSEDEKKIFVMMGSKIYGIDIK